MQQVRQTPIFDNPEAVQYDSTEQQNRASGRYDQLGRQYLDTTKQSIEYDRENKMIEYQAMKAANKSIGELQAQAHFQHQAEIDKYIIDTQKWLAEQKEFTSPEVNNELLRRTGMIKSMNAASNGLIAKLPDIKEKAKDPKYNSDLIMEKVGEIIYNPSSIQDFSSIDERIDNIFFEGLDPRVVVKDVLENKYGKRDISRSGPTKDGGTYSREYEVSDVFSGFDKEDRLIADRDRIDMDWWEQNHPEVVEKIQRTISTTIPFETRTASTMSERDLVRDAIARMMEGVGNSRLSVDRRTMSELDKARINKIRSGDGKAPIDYNQKLNEYVDGLLSGNIAKASQAVARKDGQKLKPITKKEYISRVMEQYDKGKKTKIDKKTKNVLLDKYKGLEDSEFIAIQAGDNVYPPTRDGIVSSFIALGSTNFSTRDDRVDLSNANLQLDDRVNRDKLNAALPGEGLTYEEDWGLIKEILVNTAARNRKNQEKEEDKQPSKPSNNSDPLGIL